MEELSTAIEPCPYGLHTAGCTCQKEWITGTMDVRVVEAPTYYVDLTSGRNIPADIAELVEKVGTVRARRVLENELKRLEDE